jgi:hypothetical protein
MSILHELVFPEYEKHCATEYVSGDENKLIYNN